MIVYVDELDVNSDYYWFDDKDLHKGICEYDEKKSYTIVKDTGLCSRHLVEMREMMD